MDALEQHEATLERHEAAQARGDEIEQSLEETEEAKVARWREVETGARYTRAAALAKYPQLQPKHFVNLHPFEIAKMPKSGNSRARDVKTYLAADIDALAARLAARLAEQKKVNPRWLEVGAGARFTLETAMQRYPQLSKRSFEDLPAEKVRRPTSGNAHACDVNTYSVSDIEKLVARQAAPEPVDSRWREVESGARYTAATAMARPRVGRRRGGGGAGAGGGDEGGDVAGAGDGSAAGDEGGDDGGGDDGAGGDEGAGDDGSAENRAKRPRLLGPPLPQPPPGPEVTFLQDAAPELVDNLKSRELVRRWRDASATAAARWAAANALEDADWKEQQDPGRTCYCVSTFDSHHYDSNKDDAAADVARGALACEARAQELLRSDKALRVVRVLEAAILKGDRDRAAARRIVAATLFTRHHAEIKCLIHIKFDNLDAVDIVMMTTLPDCTFCRGFMGAIGQVHQNVIVPHCLRPPGMPLRDAPALYYVRC
ncbi:hypothetical protein JL721_1463 [Aureococcus anophagefferens]|nr:hypothetical protein JL721_1463 [Aureococcus anophagefferens]